MMYLVVTKVNNEFVRMLGISIENFKNTHKGKIKLSSMNTNKIESDIIGIYGQNGSGKTSIITAISIIKKMISREQLDKDVFKYMMVDEKSTKIVVKFLVETKNNTYETEYIVVITKDKIGDECIPVIKKESLVYWDYSEGNKNRKKSLIEVNNSKNGLKPSYRYEQLKKFFSDENDLIVEKKLSYMTSRSFIFSGALYNLIEKLPVEFEIIKALELYATSNLFIVENEMLALSDANLIIPIVFRSYDRHEAGVIPIALNKPKSISLQEFEAVKKSLDSSNKVIEKLIPGLKIELRLLNTRLNEEGIEVVDVELLSIRGNREIPIRYESDGIKKIVSIIHLLIGVYNYKALTVAIDEIDSGIFEYLLGEIIEILSKGAKGQLIFTSHNLRPLEVLNNSNLVFSTSNSHNRFIRMKNVNTNNNIRDMYYRTLVLDGQEEKLYNNTSQIKIRRAFEKAGELL